MNIGFIGLGIMGKPMAKNLLKNDYKLTVYDINSQVVKELEKSGARIGSNPADIASKSDVIITMLPNSPHVKEVVLGENGVIHGVRKGSILIDMSSISPIVSKEVGEALFKAGVEMLDAPVSGGEPKAIEGTIAVMVGGKEDIFTICYDIMMAMAGSVVHVGDLGAGNTTKLANQMIVALNIAAVSEAMVLATKAGVDPEKVYKAIRGGLAGSTVMDAKVPLMLDRKFDPGFRIELHIKDLMNVMDAASSLDVPVPLSSQVTEYMKAMRVDGKEKQDHGGLVQFFEKLAGVKVERNN
jgi:2-hydroxy-3-oxopropionate reductase